MTYLKTLARVAGLGLCVVALSGTALADPGNGNGNGPATTPPGQEQKAETPAASAPTLGPAPQAAAGQEQKAENQAQQQAQQAVKQAESKPAANSAAAKAAAPGQAKRAEKQAEKAESKPTKSAPSLTSQSANAHHHVIICHRTGSLSNPYVVINIPYTAWVHAHSDTTGSHPELNGNKDKMLKDPASRPGSKDGFTKASCGAPVAPTTQVTPAAQQNAIATSSSNIQSAVQVQSTVPGAVASAQAAAGGVSGVVASEGAAQKKNKQPAGGVLGAVASGPAAVAETATTGTLPFTGIPLWIAALIGGALLATGLVLRRTA